MERVFRWFSNATLQRRMAVVLVVVTAISLRALVSGFGYSGRGKPPMYGDYEAQRHWMEITTNLPISEWYVNTSSNDLLYWGLDYPPLTAYHSWFVGKLFGAFEPAAVALFESRGYETSTSKAFMRLSVIFSESLTFLPAVVYFCHVYHFHLPFERKMFAITLASLQFVCTIIDHGHFQYNSIMLFFVTIAAAAIAKDSLIYDLVAAVSFSMAILFKQMALHYALAFFGVLFGRCLQEKSISRKVSRFFLLGLVTCMTVALVCLPWLTSRDQFGALLTRIFPVGRGLWEDKVANFWCAFTPAFNLKEYPRHIVLRTCLWTTLAGSMFQVGGLIAKPTSEDFMSALISTSLSFFLFSYQVHEKTILQSMLPLTLVSANYPFLSLWATSISIFSLWPLLVKDGLIIPYFVLQVVVFSLSCLQKPGRRLFFWGSLVSYSGIVIYHVAEVSIPPPWFYPNLYSYLCAWWSCGHFLALWWYFIWQQYSSTVSRRAKVVSGVNPTAHRKKD